MHAGGQKAGLAKPQLVMPVRSTACVVVVASVFTCVPVLGADNRIPDLFDAMASRSEEPRAKLTIFVPDDLVT